MMENSKVNTMANTGAVHNQPSSTLSHKEWLKNVCVIINQSDFDTCGNSYSDGDYQVRHLSGYDKEFRTYMNQFEN